MTTYLEEDLSLISKYFPGAKTVTLHTPFDLTIRPQDPWKLRSDDCGIALDSADWSGDMAWNR